MNLLLSQIRASCAHKNPPRTRFIARVRKFSFMLLDRRLKRKLSLSRKVRTRKKAILPWFSSSSDRVWREFRDCFINGKRLLTDQAKTFVTSIMRLTVEFRVVEHCSWISKSFPIASQWWVCVYFGAAAAVESRPRKNNKTANENKIGWNQIGFLSFVDCSIYPSSTQKLLF